MLIRIGGVVEDGCLWAMEQNTQQSSEERPILSQAMSNAKSHIRNGALFALGLLLGTALFFSSSCYPQRQQPVSVARSTGETPIVRDLQASHQAVLQGDTAEKRRELFRLGYRFLQAKDYAGARLFLSRALEVYPPLTDYSLYFLGIVNREDGHPTEARAFFLRLLEQYTQSIWTSSAAFALASLALVEKDWANALRYAQDARNGQHVRASLTHKANLILAQALEGQGDVSSAYSWYQEVRRTTPYSHEGKRAKEQIERIRTLDSDRFGLRSEQDYLAEMQLHAKEGDSFGLEALVSQFNEAFPGNTQQLEILPLLASTYKKQRRTEDAVRLWKEIADRSPDTSTGSVALFRAATLLWNSDHDDDALVLFERLTQQYAQQSQAADAWYAIGRIYQERKDDTQAMAAFERLATLYPRSQLAREGRWRQAWLAYRSKDFSVAESRFAALARSAANTREGESALYWQARTLEQQGQADQATELYRQLLRRYPDSYYTVWAEKRLGESPSPLPSSSETATVAPPSMSPITESHYIKSLELRQMGLTGFAQQELDVVRENTSQDSTSAVFFLKEYAQVDGHHRALRFAQKLGRSVGNTWPYLYPQAYWTTVSTQAQEKRLDPYLVLSIMRQESVFDPEVVSPAQAYGLMQLLPSTASRVSGITPETALPLSDPTFNIQTGSMYLRQLLDRYSGNFILAIAAYNGGEQAVDRWLRRYPGLAPDEFVEHISYRETRNYVYHVLQNYRTYLRLHGSGTIPNVAG
jgi:soluble lytic murein transglycosylase